MNNINELLEKLKIAKSPIQNDNGSYTIDIENSNEFSRYYSKLEKAEFLEQDDEASQITEDVSNLQYINEDFIITLIGDFEENTYKMVIRQVEK